MPPDEFIPLAESTGLMRRLTMFVLRESLEQLAAWHELGFSELHTAVNLSARSLIDLELADEIQQLLVDTGVPAEKLTLEITETQMMADTDAHARRCSTGSTSSACRSRSTTSAPATRR